MLGDFAKAEQKLIFVYLESNQNDMICTRFIPKRGIADGSLSELLVEYLIMISQLTTPAFPVHSSHLRAENPSH